MPKLTFVPADLNPANTTQLEPLFRALLDRNLTCGQDLQTWLRDASELEARIDEYGSRRFIEHSCFTDDKTVEKSYLHFVETVEPKLKPWTFELRKKLVNSPHVNELEESRFATMLRSWRNSVELFCEENIPLETEETKLYTQYGKIAGKMMVDFQGERLTLQQMAKYLEEPDRDLRRQAWELTTERRARDREEIDNIFSELLRLRVKIAGNAGFTNYRDYTFRHRERFDYTAEDCLRFGDAIAKHCLPMVEALDRHRKEKLNVNSLRPWDLTVDLEGRGPLRPFSQDGIEEFVAKTRKVFHLISPELGEGFSRLEIGKNLDLDSRQGKRPGGFQASLESIRQPFIFMNAVGTQRDVETLLHEGGHALHYLDAAAEPLVYLRHAPLEFCEVASMAMELLGANGLGVFYEEDVDVKRARRKHLEGIVRFLPWMATIDEFQHWIYTHPNQSSADRRKAWLAIQGKFTSSVVDWSGLEEARAWRWQPQIHIFGMPFYYIEYGIAQLGALQVWRNYRLDSERTLRQLRNAFALGGKRSLPVLFKTAGLEFDFSSKILGPLLAEVENELQHLV